MEDALEMHQVATIKHGNGLILLIARMALLNHQTFRYGNNSMGVYASMPMLLFKMLIIHDAYFIKDLHQPTNMATEAGQGIGTPIPDAEA